MHLSLILQCLHDIIIMDLSYDICKHNMIITIDNSLFIRIYSRSIIYTIFANTFEMPISSLLLYGLR